MIAINISLHVLNLSQVFHNYSTVRRRIYHLLEGDYSVQHHHVTPSTHTILLYLTDSKLRCLRQKHTITRMYSTSRVPGVCLAFLVTVFNEPSYPRKNQTCPSSSLFVLSTVPKMPQLPFILSSLQCD